MPLLAVLFRDPEPTRAPHLSVPVIVSLRLLRTCEAVLIDDKVMLLLYLPIECADALTLVAKVMP